MLGPPHTRADANTSGGALPYLVMRHRPSNSLVISIRGTGGSTVVTDVVV